MDLTPKAIAALNDEFCVRTDADIVVARWHRAWSRVTASPRGVTGWVTVVRSWKGTANDEAIIRSAAHAVLR